jgi:hypothetical protein
MPRSTRRRTKLIRPERFPPEMLERVARLYAEGLTMTDVGRRVGLYREAVNRLLQSQGIPIRPQVRTPSYRSAHHRVSRVRGKASEHRCPCGARAKDWAYMHTDPDQIEGVTGKGTRAWFSVKPEHYEPRCRSCHTKMDNFPATAEGGEPANG